MRDGVQLITYVDRLGGGGVATVNELLTGSLSGVFTGVHLLPFYLPYDGADAGFDPVDHGTVDPRLGNWDDIARISDTHDVMADLIANHISDESPQFVDFLEHGNESEYAGMFLEPAAVFPEGPSQQDLAAIYRPRPGSPFTVKRMFDGTDRSMWSTFTPHQIDLDMTDAGARQYLLDVLDRLAGAGVGQVRLDAIGYAVKTAGTSCFMTADTIEFVKELGSAVHERGMKALLELHSHYSEQVEASTIADWVYNFALPPLLLHAFYTGVATHLTDWLRSSPTNTITVLDTHDGIGVVDAGPDGDKPGLLTPDQIDELVAGIHAASNGESALATGAAASNLDLYQVNCTFYSALGHDDDRYLLARLVQFLAPGLPQVYYAGLLAAPNDMDLLEKTGVGRDINRPYYSMAQIDAALQRPVVRRLMALARFRNTHSAFEGTCTIETGAPHELLITRKTDSASIEARISFRDATFRLEESHNGASSTRTSWDEF
ncbi:MAG: sucrose phosphorylase [bacterium]|nr:sucrose phosphorylase [bacterium]